LAEYRRFSRDNLSNTTSRSGATKIPATVGRREAFVKDQTPGRPAYSTPPAVVTIRPDKPGRM
jgi:hypothetical protein